MRRHIIGDFDYFVEFHNGRHLARGYRRRKTRLSNIATARKCEREMELRLRPFTIEAA